MQLGKVLDKSTELVDRSLDVSSNPAISLLIGWQSAVIITLGFAVFWLVRDKFSMTKEFVSVMSQVNNSLDDIANIARNTTAEIKEAESTIIERIKESISYVEKIIEKISKV